MTKRDLIDQITEANPGAHPGFLAQFDQAELRLYLSKLNILKQPRMPARLPKPSFRRPEPQTQPQIEPQVEQRPARASQVIEFPTQSACPAATSPAETGRMGLYRPTEPEPILPAEPEPQIIESPAAAPVAVAAGPAPRPADTIDDESWLF